MAGFVFIQMSGPPGSGKTTVAAAIARRIGAVVIDHDVTKTARSRDEILRHGIAPMKRPARDYLLLDTTRPLEACIEQAITYIEKERPRP